MGTEEWVICEAMPTQLETWKGRFGDDYTVRNAVEWRSRLDGWRSIIGGLHVKRILEVGCNRGHNLVALSEILKTAAEFTGVEPNLLALQIARRSTDRVAFLGGTIYDLPFKNKYFDLVFTCGVLIHIPNGKLKKALHELVRVASRYVLLIEYFSEQDEEISYRGRTGLLWKRNFPRHVVHVCEELTVVRQGYLGRDEGFDRTHWWLMEKNAGLGPPKSNRILKSTAVGSGAD